MEISKKQHMMLTGKLCPYCGKEPEFADSNLVYRRSYGMIWLCRRDRAWVGCHPGTDKPLGRLANHKLRHMKMLAHIEFDKLWQSKKMKRAEAYAWLGEVLNVPKKYCHIGMFSEKTCQKVIDVSREKYNQLTKSDNYE